MEKCGSTHIQEFLIIQAAIIIQTMCPMCLIYHFQLVVCYAR
jgi:hypothetical protein